LSKLEQEELKLKQQALDKQNIQRQKQDLLIQMENEKENINLKSQYETDIQNFKNKLEGKQKKLELEEIQNQNARNDLLSKLEQMENIEKEK
jgi:hypothetical protein